MTGMGEKKALWWKNLRKTDHLVNLGADGSYLFFSFSSIFSLSKEMCVFLAVFTDFSRLLLKFTSEVVVLHGID
jgi:hypothetical protein